MHPTIFTSNGPIEFLPGLPPQWKGDRLPGAVPLHYIGDNGTAVLQELRTKHFCLSYFSFFFDEAASLLAKTECRLQSLLAVKGSLTCKLPKAKPFSLNEGDFILCKPIAGELKAELCTMTHGQLVTTIYHPQLYKSWMHIFPGLGKSEKKPSRSWLLTNEPRQIPIGAMDAIKIQLYQKYRPQVQQAFVQLKVEDALLNFLDESHLSPGHGLSEKQLEITAEVYNLIVTDIKAHHSIGTLARLAGTNEADLKRWFKQRFGIGMYELLLKLRIEKAKELLAQGHNIKTVAPEVGYGHTTTFIAEFKRQCGYTPLDYQKKQKR